MISKSKILHFSEGSGKWSVSLILIRTTVGKGVAAVLTGGEEPHVGAVAIGIPGPIVHHPEKIKSSTSVFTLFGHMDDQIAVPSATKLAEKLGEPVVVVCGLHIHSATTDDIKKLIKNSNIVIKKAIKAI